MIELSVYQREVASLHFQQIFVTSTFHYDPILYDHYDVTVADCRQSVRDDDASPSLRRPVDGRLHDLFDLRRYCAVWRLKLSD